MLTLQEAKLLQYGNVLVDTEGGRWRVTGQVKTWVRDPNRIRVPLKHGLYVYGSIDTSDFDSEGVCHSLTKLWD